MATLAEMQHSWRSLIEDSREILDVSEKENRGLNDDERLKYDKIQADMDALKERIDNEIKQRKVEKSLDDVVIPSREERKITYEEAFIRFMKGDRDARVTSMLKDAPEFRGTSTQTSTSATLGQKLVPEEWGDFVVTALKAYGGMYENVDIIRTAGGNTFHLPTIDTTAQVGQTNAEANALTVQDITINEFTLSCFTYVSDLVKVSWELLNDDAYNFQTRVAQVCFERIGRILNQHMTTGDGSSKITGIDQTATQGLVSASTSAVTFDEMINLYHTVDPLYRANSRWMFSDTSFRDIRKLKDGNNMYLWDPGLPMNGEQGTLLGKPLVINQDVPDITAGAKAIYFGDLSKYILREVKGMGMVSLSERFADSLSSGYFAFGRWDGDLSLAAAVKYIRITNT